MRKGTITLDDDAAVDDYNDDDDGAQDNRRALSPIGCTRNTPIIILYNEICKRHIAPPPAPVATTIVDFGLMSFVLFSVLILKDSVTPLYYHYTWCASPTKNNIRATPRLNYYNSLDKYFNALYLLLLATPYIGVKTIIDRYDYIQKIL